MFSPKFVYVTKNTPFFPILHVFAPLNDVRTYSAWSWKTTLITWIFGWAWYPLDIRVAPRRNLFRISHRQTFQTKGCIFRLSYPKISHDRTHFCVWWKIFSVMSPAICCFTENAEMMLFFFLKEAALVFLWLEILVLKVSSYVMWSSKISRKS